MPPAVEGLLLILFWAWAITVALFLKTTRVPRCPVAEPPASLNLSYEPVRFQATDGVWLSGWKLLATARAPWILGCHSLGRTRTELLPVATILCRAGYNVLLFDFRGHGLSGGRATSFGWHEQRDVEGALAFLGSQPDAPDSPYGILGLSMGAAAAVLVAARDERLGALILDSAYANLRRSFSHHIRRLYHLPQMPFAAFVAGAYRLRFGVLPSRVSPREQIGALGPRAVLIIQDARDPLTPADDARQLYERAHPPKDLWVTDYGIHLGALEREPDQYGTRAVAFFQNAFAVSAS